jgi:hypothetical protein
MTPQLTVQLHAETDPPRPVSPGAAWCRDDAYTTVDWSGSRVSIVNTTVLACQDRVRHLSICDTARDSPVGTDWFRTRSLEEDEEIYRLECSDDEEVARSILRVQIAMDLQYLQDCFPMLDGRNGDEGVVTTKSGSGDGGEFDDESSVHPPSDDNASCPPAVAVVVDYGALLAELECVDEVVGRTEVEVYERMAFAPLLVAFTKSLTAAALRGMSNKSDNGTNRKRNGPVRGWRRAPRNCQEVGQDTTERLVGTASS